VTSGPPSAKRRRSFAARHFVTSLSERFSDRERRFLSIDGRFGVTEPNVRGMNPATLVRKVLADHKTAGWASRSLGRGRPVWSGVAPCKHASGRSRSNGLNQPSKPPTLERAKPLVLFTESVVSADTDLGRGREVDAALAAG
jgi:hypothetical protein